MKYTYRIQQPSNAVEIYKDDVLIFTAPTWPVGLPWSNAKEAETYAKGYIKMMEDPEADIPPLSPGQKPMPRHIAKPIIPADIQAKIDAAKKQIEEENK